MAARLTVVYTMLKKSACSQNLDLCGKPQDSQGPGVAQAAVGVLRSFAGRVNRGQTLAHCGQYHLMVWREGSMGAPAACTQILPDVVDVQMDDVSSVSCLVGSPG